MWSSSGCAPVLTAVAREEREEEEVVLAQPHLVPLYGPNH